MSEDAYSGMRLFLRREVDSGMRREIDRNGNRDQGLGAEDVFKSDESASFQ